MNPLQTQVQYLKATLRNALERLYRTEAVANAIAEAGEQEAMAFAFDVGRVGGMWAGGEWEAAKADAMARAEALAAQLERRVVAP